MNTVFGTAYVSDENVTMQIIVSHPSRKGTCIIKTK